jgi:cellulose biosynthesis protein BcsQ
MARFDALGDQVAAERAGKHAVVIDLDPQASAAAWRDLAQRQGAGRRGLPLPSKPPLDGNREDI